MTVAKRKKIVVSRLVGELYVDLPVEIKLWAGVALDYIRLHGYFHTSSWASGYGVSQTVRRLITSPTDRSI